MDEASHNPTQIQQEEKQTPLPDGMTGKEYVATTGGMDIQSFAFLQGCI